MLRLIAEWSSHYKMSEKGLFLRENVLDVVQMENMYTSPWAFNYYMSRKSGEEWEKEQDKDRLKSGPIKLEYIGTAEAQIRRCLAI